jgi:hypothetical protein
LGEDGAENHLTRLSADAGLKRVQAAERACSGCATPAAGLPALWYFAGAFRNPRVSVFDMHRRVRIKNTREN